MHWAKIAGFIALIAFAVFLRFDALEDPNYWYDEAITSLRVAGHTEAQVAAYATDHPRFAIGELGRFVTADSSAGFGDTVRSLASEDPQHTPVYYLIARAWALLLGSSVAAGRALAALASILALPAMYWLCLELFVRSGAFTSRLVCWIGVVAMAVSPYQVAIAREHREYSLWTLTFTVACACFLRAVRKQDLGAWALFAAAMTLSIYTHVLSALGLAACGAYLLVRERFRLHRPMLSFLAASAVCGLACVPWIRVLHHGRHTAEGSLGWVQNSSAGALQLKFSLVPAWRLADISLWDLRGLTEGLPIERLAHGICDLMPLAVLAVILAMGFARAWGFPIALICSVSLPIFLMDYFTGSIAGFAYRYGVPTNLGWLLAAAMALTILWELQGKWKFPARAATAAFLSIAGLSAYLTHEHRHTWAKSFDAHWEVAQIVSAEDGATLLSDDFVGSVLALLPNARKDLPIRWRARCYSCPRQLEPILEIPDPPPSDKTYYFRSWSNVPQAILESLAERMASDRLDDPRFHTRLVPLTDRTPALFQLTPR